MNTISTEGDTLSKHSPYSQYSTNANSQWLADTKAVLYCPEILKFSSRFSTFKIVLKATNDVRKEANKMKALHAKCLDQHKNYRFIFILILLLSHTKTGWMSSSSACFSTITDHRLTFLFFWNTLSTHLHVVTPASLMMFTMCIALTKKEKQETGLVTVWTSRTAPPCISVIVQLTEWTVELYCLSSLL